MTNLYKKNLMLASLGALLTACSNGQDIHSLHQSNAANSGYQSSNHGMRSYAPQPQYMPQQYLQPIQYVQPLQYVTQQYVQPQYMQPAFGQPYMQPGLALNVGGGGQHSDKNPLMKNQPYGQTTYLRGAYNKGSRFSYESLNAFEEPVSGEFAGVTFELNGRLDSVTSYSIDDKGNPNHQVVGSHRLNAEKQLPNRLTVGATFTGRAEDIGNPDADYKGRIRGYVGGSWGTVLGGNVQDVVYQNTRRKRGAGALVGRGAREENLWSDGALGRLSDWGGGYQGRFGPTIVSAIVDEDANYDVGIEFQRPIGNKDYRFTARHNSGTYIAADGATEIDTKGVSGIGEYVYGSTRYDVGAGYEQLDSTNVEADRWFTSAGVTTKVGVWNFTAEGQYGQIEGQDEISAFAGVKYDIARGLAATAAVDYQDRQVNVDGVDIMNAKEKRALVGLSYGF